MAKAARSTSEVARGDAWRIDDFVTSLTRASANTVTAYRTDIRDFTAWCADAVDSSKTVDSPAGVDRLVLRRYLAHLGAEGFAKRSIARKA
ncbi:MAG: site-specific integrase, partial [Ilumatobacteraceae bacterium]